MIVVHHLENSRSQRVLWLLEEIGATYRIEHYRRDPATMQAPPELRAVHPLGKSPVITDEDLVVAESGAIIEYLVERHGQGRLRPPEGSPERLRYTYWLHFAEGSAMPPLLMMLVTRAIETRSPWIVRPVAAGIAKKIRSMVVTPNLERQFAFMESELEERPWFAGAEFSAADIQMSFPLEVAAVRGGLDARFPKLRDFLSRIHGRPAYERAIEAGGPYRLLG